MLVLAARFASLTAQRAQRRYTKLYQLHLDFAHMIVTCKSCIVKNFPT